MPDAEITVFGLRPDQSAIVKHPARYKFLAMGRRWGKTVMGGSLVVSCAAHGASVAWVVPTFRNARPLWRMLEASSAGVAQINRSDMIVRYPSGGWIGVYTADNPVGILGESFDLTVIDEAARIRPETWYETIMPTLADRNGRALLISTPVGKNWFYREFMRGLGDMKEQASFTAPSSANPIPAIRQAAERARQYVSERTYRQEWLAEFVDDGAFFQNIDKLAVLKPQPAQPEHRYVIGVDWARSSGGDYTVFAVIDADVQEMTALERMQGEPFVVQMARLKSLWQRYNKPQIVAEANAMGQPVIEQMRLDGLPVTAFQTTAQSKHQVVTALELAFDQMALKLLDDPTLIMEMNAFEQKTRLGYPSYGAPPGFHDDTVIATALAWYGVTNVGRGGRVWAEHFARKLEAR